MYDYSFLYAMTLNIPKKPRWLSVTDPAAAHGWRAKRFSLLSIRACISCRFGVWTMYLTSYA